MLLLAYKAGVWRITNQQEAFWGDIMVRVVLNLSTEEDSDNLGEKGGGKRYYGATPIWINGELAVRVEKIKLCTVNAVNGREEDSKGGRFEGMPAGILSLFGVSSEMMTTI